MHWKARLYPPALPSKYILIIAEKARAAEKIAQALGGSFAKMIRIHGVPVWIVKWQGKDYVIAPAAGHLFTLHTDEKEYPVFSFKWVPRYLVDEEAKHTKKFLDVLKLLAKNAIFFINACDYDIEGSLIGYMIIKHVGDVTRAARARFSSLTKQEIIKAFSNLSPLDMNMVEAGYCRHALDWLWGINISRALMDVYHRAFGKSRILSAGRVQTPTLAHAVQITLERRLHVPDPLFYPIVKINVNNTIYTLENLDDPFKSKHEVQEYVNSLRRYGYVVVEDINVKNTILPPPHPFNLPDLQAEAYRIYGLSPYRVQRIAEDLYLDALISYPRTNSQKLPPTLDNREILEKLKNINSEYRRLVTMLLRETGGILRPNNGPKDDPAHPAIYPTGEFTHRKLSTVHYKIYDLIVRRYLATFSKPAHIRYIDIVFRAGHRRFILRGVQIIEYGWLKYYPFAQPKEKAIPYTLFKRGQRIPISSVSIRIVYSKPPSPPSRYSLLKWMESVNIGTESTRAEIIEVLYKRGYLVSRKGAATEASDLGIAIVSVLRKYLPQLTSVDLTRQFEEYIDKIKSMRLKCDPVLSEAKTILSTYLAQFKRYLNVIARELYKYIEPEGEQLKTAQSCQICHRMAVDKGFCIFHLEAYKRILEHYPRWRDAGYDWHSYLSKLIQLRSTGKYVKDVCHFLLRSRYNLRH